jgi:hypothetical protein
MKQITFLLNLVAAAVLILSLSACGLLDVATETPSDQPPEPTATQDPTTCTNHFVQVGSANLDLGQEFDPGAQFHVEWIIKNAGTCIWTPTYALVNTSGDSLGAPSRAVLGAFVSPEETVTLRLPMLAPITAGEYPSLWKLQNDLEQIFGTMQDDAPLRVVINVTGSLPTPEPTPTIEPTQGPPPGTHIFRFDETLPTAQCFDFVGGQVISCADADADIRFNFLMGQGGNILPLHHMNMAQGLQSAPNRSDCESESYFKLPLMMSIPTEYSTGRHYCFYTDRNSTRYYGWLQPVDFNDGGLTFSFVTYAP